MEILAFIFLITSLCFFLVLVPFSYSIAGVWFSEIGLWISGIPLGMIVFAVFTLLEHFTLLVFNINSIFFLSSILLNAFTTARILIPFYKMKSTNKSLLQNMRKYLGQDYLHYIKSVNCVDFFSCVKFKWLYYFTGLNVHSLNKRVKTIKNVVYHEIDGEELKLNIHYPNKSGLYPVIIFIHGGGWIFGSKDRPAHERMCKLLANLGYVVFNINYRLVPLNYLLNKRKKITDNPLLHEMLIDITKAIDYAREKARLYNGNASNIFLLGRSAGAHLALLTTFVANEHRKISGVVALYPVTDLEALQEFFKKEHRLKLALVNHTFGDTEDFKQIYNLFSPITYVTKDTAADLPPVFLATGDKDKLVSPQQSKKLFIRLQEFGVPSVFLDLPWANHGFDLMINGPGGQLIFKYLTQFLAWVLAKRELERIEFIAMEHGLHSVVSKEKISSIYSSEATDEVIIKENPFLTSANYEKEKTIET